MGLVVNTSSDYARRYDVTRAGVDLWIDLDLRAEWRGIANAGTYSVSVQGATTLISQGPYALGLTGAPVLAWFTTLLDGVLGGTEILTVNSFQDYAREHDVTYNTTTDYLIRLDILRNNRAVLTSAGALIDAGKWRVNALSGAQVTDFFEQMIYAATGVAPTP